MSCEVIQIKLIHNEKNIIIGELTVDEQSFTNKENFLLEISFAGKKISKENDDLFSALQLLRKDLEKNNLQIMCNGAARNVYPSPMQISMGGGRMAYLLHYGQMATVNEIVDIFECNESLEFVSVEEQSKFYTDWLQSNKDK